MGFFESIISFFEMIYNLIVSIAESITMAFQVVGIGGAFASNVTMLVPTILSSAVLIVMAIATLKLILSVF